MPIQLIHPAAVHFPIVFVLSLFAVDGFALARDLPLTSHSGLGRASIVLVIFAGISAIVAYVFGDQAFDIARASGTKLSVLEAHEEMGTATATAVAVWGLLRGFAFWRGLSISGARSGAVVLVELVLVGLILTTAFYGGQLVYEHGVAVTTHRGG
jgi:uncharacterized membrane protein